MTSHDALKFAFAASGLLFALGCSGDPASTTPPKPRPAQRADVNDLAILWSIPSANERALLISLDDGRDGKPLLTDTQLQQLIGFETPAPADPPLSAGPPAAGIDDRGSWRVIALRADPCQRADDPSDTSAAGCHFEVRLVLQPITDAGFADAAMHLIFELPQSRVATEIQAFMDLKADAASEGVITNGVPLGVHPAIAKQGLSGKFAQGLKSYIQRTFNEGDLTAAAIMVSYDPHFWRFAKGSRAASGDLEILETPGTDHALRMQLEILPLEANISPKATGLHTANDFPVKGTTDATLTTAALSDALFIDNPTLRTPKSGDCISCHVASHRVLGLSANDPSILAPSADTNPNRYPQQPGITQTFTAINDRSGDDYNTRSFGYVTSAGLTHVSYTQGTVNDAAKVAVEVNALIAAGAVR